VYSSNKYPPRIWLWGINKKAIGQLIFKPDGSALPSDYKHPTLGEYGLYYHVQDLHNVIDVLRNESPVYLWYHGPGGENGIKTTEEEVGEGEKA
jgi:hypothetical protein